MNAEAERVLQIIDNVDINDVYTIGRVLGSGKFGFKKKKKHEWI